MISFSPTSSMPPTANLYYNAPSGQLIIRPEPGDNTVREGQTSDGFLEVTLNGQRHSSDPSSTWFDPALAGAGRESLAGIRIVGSQVPLALASQNITRGLTVQTEGPVDVAGAVQTKGPLAINAATITVHGSLQGTTVDVASPGLVNIAAKGAVAAQRIGVTAGVFINAGQVAADGFRGGEVAIHAGNMLQGGRISADGTTAGGGRLQIEFDRSYIASAAALTSADGVSGGEVTINGGATGRLFTSGTQEAVGRSAIGGTVALSGGDVILVGATADTAGQAGDGILTIGTRGSLSPLGGEGGRPVTMTAATLRGRLMVENTTGDRALASGFHLVDPHPTRAGAFGFTITPLSNGNLVVTTPHDNFVAGDSGAVYLVQGRTGALLGALVGSAAGDRLGDAGDPGGDGPLAPGPTGPVGDSVVPLTNGNYVVLSPRWSKNRGAATWGDGTVGITGTVDASNSLVGSNPGNPCRETNTGDCVGLGRVAALSNGNYVVISPFWNSNRGAATWGDGTDGITGTVDASNSLIGSNANDLVAFGGVTALSNGNYVVASREWNGGRGAATWGDGTIGITGTVDAGNSLVGSNRGDGVGGSGVTALSNGNYVVASGSWNNYRGAATGATARSASPGPWTPPIAWSAATYFTTRWATPSRP